MGPQGSWALVHRTTCTTCMAATATHFSLQRGSKVTDIRKCSSDISQLQREAMAHCSPVLTDVVCCVSTLCNAFLIPTIVGIIRPLVGCLSASSNVVARAKFDRRPLSSLMVSRSLGLSSLVEEVTSMTFFSIPSAVSSALLDQ